MTSSMRVKSPRPIGRRNTTEHFIIFTNTKKTEKYYFEGLSKYCKTIEKNVCIEVKLEKNLLQLVPRALKRVTPLNHVWIVFDYDQEKHFDEIIQKAEDEGIHVAWSNPCFEVWLLAYFEQISSDIVTSSMCIDELKRIFLIKTEKEYKKNDKDIYNHLYNSGDGEDEAFKRAETMKNNFDTYTPPSKMVPATRVDELVKKILKK